MTSTGGEFVALSGPENPYPDGKPGMIEVGAYAEIPFVEGDPLEDISAIGGHDKWFDAGPRSQGLRPIRVLMKIGNYTRTRFGDECFCLLVLDRSQQPKVIEWLCAGVL